MKKATPIINRLDKERLEPHLTTSGTYAPTYLLRHLLEQAKAVEPDQVPSNIVTMNSRIVVRDPLDDELQLFVLAYPGQDGADTISVVSPLGSALLAAREGSTVSFMGARAPRRVILEEVEYQPERAGDFDL